MAISSDDYLLKRSKQIERKKRIVTYLGLFSFCGSILFGGVTTIQKAWESTPSSPVQSVETELQKQVKGYELVLQREPNNQVALEKLSIIRLQSGDKQGAIALMEKLVKQHPDRQDYQTILVDTKRKIGEQQPNNKK
ncbi:tetratricopeptide repeat protein [Anabaena cylindrica UHCC 0172]|uniref:tetratricopeptide repeat protein n=1 Tax=Anabaena cylindrica TaxID=1165 RepID=UPI002B1FC320|nr:tetratricopeptide repeat protein [Anabaena cylindrica]MEA5549883.1 tetratricopeptide repeat protein [Anabaena cylindrica UHCC 0172]